MKPEYNNKRPSRCLARLVLRWLVLGWWLVPILLVMRFLAEIQEHYWTGDDTGVYWHTDDSMTMVIGWINACLKPFFPQNTATMAGDELL